MRLLGLRVAAPSLGVLLLGAVASTLAGCGGEGADPTPDAGGVDGGSGDLGGPDAGRPDGGAADAGPADTGAGPGCGDLDAFDWRDVVLYFALVDRFRDGDGARDPVEGATDGDARVAASGQYEGGDLAGVTERLPYLADLGVTALWLSAPFDNRDSPGAGLSIFDQNLYTGYHGYWPKPPDVDWSDPEGVRPRVEPRIGDAADLRTLITTAHATETPGGHGIKVLADYVMNHVDDESPLYLAHPEWFATDAEGEIRLCEPDDLWDDPFWGTRCAFARYLPPFDFSIPEARAWSIADAVWWATEFGFDGYRLDAIKHVPDRWLTELRSALGQAIPEPAGGRFYLVGETFSYSPETLRRFVEPGAKLDGQFDFPMKDQLCRSLFTRQDDMSTLARWMDDNVGFYGPGAIMGTWIGNHDIPRAIHFASGEITDCRTVGTRTDAWTEGRWPQPAEAAPYERLALAFAVLMTNPGVPLVYYGDEIGLAGGADPDNRRLMPWEDDPAAPALAAPQLALREAVRALARMRAEHPVLSRGVRTTLSSSEDTWVYRMGGCGDEAPVLTATNRADTPRSVTLPEGAYTDLLSGETVAGGPLELPPRGYRVLAED